MALQKDNCQMPSFWNSRGFREQHKIDNLDSVNNVGIKGVPSKFHLQKLPSVGFDLDISGVSV